MTQYEKQIEVERKFDKKNIPDWILTELDEELSTHEMFIKAVDLVQAHLDRSPTFYSSKRIRYMTVKSTPAMEIAYQVFYAVLSSTSDSMSLAGTATQIGLAFHSDQLNAVKTGAELLGVLEEIGLYSVSQGYQTDDENVASTIIKNYSLSESTLNKIHATQYLPPMLVEPLPWSSNKDGGTLTKEGHCILGNGNQHNGKQNLRVLNKVQSIAWKSTPIMFTQEPDAKPRKIGETAGEYDRRLKQHAIRTDQSAYIYDLFKNESKFYFEWAYDKRGREYSKGYDINLQGSEFKKASIEFANEELICIN